MPPTTTTSAREARSVPFRTFSPASATCRRSASVPITNAVRPERVSCEQMLQRAAHGHHVAEGRPDAELPETGHVVLGPAARIVGRERHLLARVAQRLHRLDGARGGLVADPDGAVEIEDELVVGGSEGRERHVASLRRHAQAAFSAALRDGARVRRVRRRRRRSPRRRSRLRRLPRPRRRPAARTSPSRRRATTAARRSRRSRSTRARPTRSTSRPAAATSPSGSTRRPRRTRRRRSRRSRAAGSSTTRSSTASSPTS